MNILAAIQAINSGLGELPMLAAEEKNEAALKIKENEEGGNYQSQSQSQQQSKAKVSTKILADGTYASEINEEAAAADVSGRQLPNIKSKTKG